MADLKISQLANSAALTGVERFPVVQTGSTVAANIGNIISFISGQDLAPTVTQSYGGRIIDKPQLKAYREAVYANTAVSANLSLDLSLYNVFNLTLTASITLTLINPANSAQMSSATVILRQDGTGSRVVTWAGQNTTAGSGTVAWPNATTPTLTTTLNKTDIVTFFTADGGTKYFGAFGPANYT